MCSSVLLLPVRAGFICVSGSVQIAGRTMQEGAEKEAPSTNDEKAFTGQRRHSPRAVPVRLRRHGITVPLSLRG